MSYLLTAGILGLFLGILLVFFPAALGNLNSLCNRVLVYLDEKLYAVRTLTGIVLVILGIWFIYATPSWKEWWGLPLAGALAIIFGLLFAVFPKTLVKVSEWGNTLLLTTDDVVIKSRLSVGVVLILISIYLLFVGSKL